MQNEAMFADPSMQGIFACSSIFVIICLLPYMICELYWGFNDISCQNEHNTLVGFTIRSWLLVDGFIMLFNCVFLLALLCKPDLINIWTKVSVVIQYFIFCWVCSGCALYWGDGNSGLEATHACGKSLQGYLNTRLGLGLFHCFEILKVLFQLCGFCRAEPLFSRRIAIK